MSFFKKHRAFREGKLKSQEAEEFVDWVNSSEGEEEIINEIENDWNFLEAKQATGDVKLDNILSEITAQTNPAKPHKSSKYQWVLKVAAAVTVLVMVSFLTNKYLITESPLSHSEWVVKTNPCGQKSTLFLPDGSKVYLNAESKLSYERGFGGEVRKVELVGEGFFEVAKDENKPFVVTTGDFSTMALGTSFNIRAYDSDQKMEVALVTGQVLVETSLTERKFILQPGERLSYEKDKDLLEKSHFDIDEIIGWKEGLIKFNKANFLEVEQKLERWFGVQISYNKMPDQEWTYTGKFKNQSLEMILEGMKLTKNFEYKIDKKNVNLMFN